MSANPIPAIDEDRAVVSTRLLDYSPAQVFEAYRNPDLLAQWWGPTGFTNTFSIFEFEVGGRWEFVMHGPDGTDYPNHSVFEEIVPAERIVFQHLDEMHLFQMTILLEERDGKTQHTWRMLHPNAESCSKVRDFIPAAMQQNFDRLEAVLSRTAQPT